MRTIFDNSLTSTPSTTEYWPFVRVVRIYVKAKALSTGATLVDLPSIIDSNAQRAAVAQEYMQKCHAHWIVSPINRAIDERVARDLLSPNLRLQLHMDGAVDTREPFGGPDDNTVALRRVRYRRVGCGGRCRRAHGGTHRMIIVENADPFVTRERARLEKFVAELGDRPATGVLVLEVASWPANTRPVHAP